VEKALALRQALYDFNCDKAETLLKGLLQKFLCVRNTSPEYFYHDFVSAVMRVNLTPDESLDSDWEAGNGYAVLTLVNVALKTAMILVFKTSSTNDILKLLQECDGALDEIENTQCADKFGDFQKIYAYGLAFKGKTCALKGKILVPT